VIKRLILAAVAKIERIFTYFQKKITFFHFFSQSIQAKRRFLPYRGVNWGESHAWHESQSFSGGCRKGVCMKMTMKTGVLLVSLMAGFVSCAGASSGANGAAKSASAAASADDRSAMGEELPDMEELAEVERNRGFFPGLGLTESNIREKSGDYAGAVLAVYKELAWAYSKGVGSVGRDGILAGLNKLLEADTATRFSEDGQKQNAAAVKAITAFMDSRWSEAEALLTSLFGTDTEADSYSRWMLLVCALEKGDAGKESRSAYSSIRSRYASFPEYWYYGARIANQTSTGDYAERCINLAPSGPYSAECRGILAKALGLSAADGAAIKTRIEIEAFISVAVNQKKPDVLSDLLPLIALPDNASTMYAVGALRSLASENIFYAWFTSEAKKAKGRLADRLQYISRG
jgi:hypothetical protein